MSKTANGIKEILAENKYVVQRNHEQKWKNSAGVTLLAATGFFVMSFLNVYHKSYVMLYSTAFCSIMLYLDYLVARRKQNLFLIHSLLMPIITVTFTYYVIIGGNNGFAALWLIIVPLTAMLMTDLKYGFFMSLYFLVFLIMTFLGPCRGWLRYDYSETFLLRFPFLYAISFCLSTYAAVLDCRYRYSLDKREEELHRLGSVDMMTGLLNRNSYNEFELSFDAGTVSSVSVIYVDVNGLHETNNLGGHEAGDRMLRQIAAECAACFSGDRVYRMGGDEFLIIALDRDKSSIEKAAMELEARIRADGYSASFGQEHRSSGIDIIAMTREADRKMLLNKAAYYTKKANDRRSSRDE